MKKIIAVLTTVLAMSACGSITGPTPDDDDGMTRVRKQLEAAAGARPKSAARPSERISFN